MQMATTLIRQIMFLKPMLSMRTQLRMRAPMLSTSKFLRSSWSCNLHTVVATEDSVSKLRHNSIIRLTESHFSWTLSEISDHKDAIIYFTQKKIELNFLGYSVNGHWYFYFGLDKPCFQKRPEQSVQQQIELWTPALWFDELCRL